MNGKTAKLINRVARSVHGVSAKKLKRAWKRTPWTARARIRKVLRNSIPV